MEIYIFLYRPNVHYFVARLLAAEEMQDEKNISTLENVDLYGLILSMLGNCCTPPRLSLSITRTSHFLNMT